MMVAQEFGNLDAILVWNIFLLQPKASSCTRHTAVCISVASRIMSVVL